MCAQGARVTAPLDAPPPPGLGNLRGRHVTSNRVAFPDCEFAGLAGRQARGC